MPRSKRLRSNRGGFAFIEPFIVFPMLLGVGLLISFSLRWGFQTDHWAAWLPAALLGIPFALLYGLIVPLMIAEHVGSLWKR